MERAEPARTKARPSGFTFIEILVVMSIIVVLAGMVMVGVPYVREQGRRTESLSNVRGLALLLSGQSQQKRAWPPFDGKNFLLSLVATGEVDARRPDNLKVFFSPGDTKYTWQEKVQIDGAKRYKDITLQSLKSGTGDFKDLTSYAGRLNTRDECRITPDKESMVVPLVCDDDDGNLHHPKGLIMAFTDGSAQFKDWSDLGMQAGPEEVDGDVEPFLGDDARSEDLKCMSSE